MEYLLICFSRFWHEKLLPLTSLQMPKLKSVIYYQGSLAAGTDRLQVEWTDTIWNRMIYHYPWPAVSVILCLWLSVSRCITLEQSLPLSLSGILNLPQQLAYNNGIFMHKVLNNNSSNYLAQLFISHQSHYPNTRNSLYGRRPRLDLFKTSISFAGASLWNSLPQNIKSCISLPCFRLNLHKYMSENNLSSNLDGFVWITCLPKNLIVLNMSMKEI